MSRVIGYNIEGLHHHSGKWVALQFYPNLETTRKEFEAVSQKLGTGGRHEFENTWIHVSGFDAFRIMTEFW